MSQIGYMFLGVGHRRVRERDVPPDDARVLQGAALPRRRHRHPRARRRAGHPQDGRPAAVDAVHVRGDSSSARSRSSGIPPFSGFFSKDSILAPRSTAAGTGTLLWVAGLVGTFLTGLYTFRMLFIVFWRRAVAVRARAPSRTRTAKARSYAGRWALAGRPCSAVRRRDRRLDPVRSRLDAVSTGSSRSRGRSSRRRHAGGDRRACSPSRSASPGIGVAWSIYGARSAEAPRRVAADGARAQVLLRRALRRRVLPARRSGLAHALGRWIERPLIIGSVRGSPSGLRELGLGTGAPPDRPRPHLRARARGGPRRPRPRLRGGAMMDTGWITTALILLPVGGALAGVAAAAAAASRSARPRCSSRSSRSASGSTRSRASTSTSAACSSSQQAELVQRPGRLLPRRHVYGFSLWLVGLTVVVLAAAIAYAFWAGRERPRAYFGLMLLLTGAIVGVFTAQDLLALLRLLGGDADPALRADRRLGRAGPAAARRSSSSSTRWPARC